MGNARGDASRPATTALAAVALIAAGEEAFARRSQPFLINSCIGGHWPDAIDRPFGHTVTRWGDAWCVHALALVASEPTARTLLPLAIETLLASFHEGPFQYGDSIIHAWPTRDALLAMTAVLERERLTAAIGAG